MAAQKRARSHGIVKEEKAWKVSMKQKIEAFKNAPVWDIEILHAKN
jgi:hypothetical protein